MKIFNTLGRQKQEFKPIKKGQIFMYHCGPTVYWTQHIGNMRAMVLADLVVRTFEYLGFKVKLNRNYTDVGHLTSDDDTGQDKMEKAAKREKLDPQKIADKYIAEFEQDINALNVKPADFKPKATECITDSIKFVQILLDKGFVYSTPLAIYFDVSKAKNYTALSGQDLQEQMKGLGKAEVQDKDKKNAQDFAVWFFAAGTHQNALQTWPSPFKSELVADGRGFPGWHLECSVMANKFLGPTIDLHMGGVEHIPIHHTNEIAQSEAANGVKFVNYWLHNEHLMVDGQKMSKSEGTAYVVEDIVKKKIKPLALRYFFLQAHYRSKQNFTWQALEAAENALDKLYDFIGQADEDSQKTDRKVLKNFKQKFENFLGDDFNVPQALSVVWDVVKASDISLKDKKEILIDFDKVLGLKLSDVQQVEIPDEIKKLAELREKARAGKDFTKADELRNQIENKGFVIEDSSDGFILRKK